MLNQPLDNQTLGALLGLAAFLGFFHTITGPDHFIPFVAMARVGGWSLRRTVLITAACGVGHILSSIVLGACGVGLGLAIAGIDEFQEVCGSIAGWLLLGFGVAYMTWGLVRAIRNRPHTHIHFHADGTQHDHGHAHDTGHLHVHRNPERAGSMTPWVLFTIFVFGPCESLIPLLMYPAAKLSVWGVTAVAVVFGATTLVTMLAVVVVAYLGLAQFSFPRLERYSHALAGAAVVMCGVAILFCGL